MNKLGIYFGPNFINFTETKGKKLINNIQVPFLEALDMELEEKVPLEIKLVAVINETLRTGRIEAKEVSLVLSGRDFIIRSFEMPHLPKEELASAVRFEAKKYIPFKVEELVSDFQAQVAKSSRINNILFMGLKKDILERYLTVFKQVNIKVRRLEYSGFSILRGLKLLRVKESGIIGVLCADFSGGDDANFIVLENGFPLFSRDINLASGPILQAGTGDFQAEPQAFLDKLKSEMRISLDYYQRKFPEKRIQRVFSFINHDYYQELESYMSEFYIPFKLLDFNKLIGSGRAYSLGLVKSFGASLADVIPTKVKINLSEVKAVSKSVGVTDAKFDLGNFLKDVKIDLRVIFLGIFICIAAFAYSFYKIVPVKEELNSVIKKRVTPGDIDPNLSLSQLSEVGAGYKQRLKTFDKLIKGKFYLTKALDSIPRCIPEGVWLVKFSFNEEAGKLSLLLEGRSYLRSADKEFEAVNKFVNNLKNDFVLSNYFTGIELNSVKYDTTEDKVPITKFNLICKNYKDTR
jgi:hypothetical protein